MKNDILGITAIFITIYTVLIGLNIFSIQSHKQQMENHLSRIVKNTLESEYPIGDETTALKMLEEEIGKVASEDAEISIEVQEMDLEKGVLSVLVTETFPTVTGTSKVLTFQKTAIMDRLSVQNPTVTVTFLVAGEVYKEYQIAQGEECPLPKMPEGSFGGWTEYGTEGAAVLKEIGTVWEDKVYVAVIK